MGLIARVWAIVAGTRDHKESDRIVHLLTQQGVLTVYAHGARKSRHRFSGALQLFATIEADVRRSARRPSSMPTLEAAIVLDSRLGLRDDLSKIAFGSYVVELARLVVPEGGCAEDIFILVTDTLDALLACAPDAVVRRAFELRVLSAIGVAPEVERCVSCGRRSGPAFVDLGRGGRFCIDHRGSAEEMGEGALVWMQAVLSTSSGSGRVSIWKDGARSPLRVPPLPASELARIGRVLDAGVSSLTDHRPLRSRALLSDCGL